MPPSQGIPAEDRSTVPGSPPTDRGSSVRQADLSECGDQDPALFDLFEQITRWLEAGEAVDEEQLVAEHPAWAREIRALLPTLRGMAQAGELDTGASPRRR